MKGPIIRTEPEQSRRPALFAAAAWLVLGPVVSAERMEAALAPRSAWERRTEPAAVACACIWMAMVAAPTTFVEIGGAPLVVASVARPRATGRALALFFRTPMWWILLAWAAWQGLSLLWSPDPAHGVDEMHSMRWAWSLPLVFPLLRHRRALIAAMAAGFLAGNLSQVAHGLGVALDVGWLAFDRAPMRNSGWWDPVVGGTLLVGALGLHLPAAMMGGARGGAGGGSGGTGVSPVRALPERLLGVAGSAITLIAIFATGTRGAWLAAAGLVVIVGVVALVRAPRALSWKRAGIALAATGVIAAGAWLLAGDAIGGRAREARQEIARALEGDYGTFTGQRILMARWAAEAFASRPLVGVGAGGYKAWVDPRLGAGPEGGVGPHAHNTPLHVAATTGAVGLAVFGLAWVAAIRAGMRGDLTQSTKHKAQSSHPQAKGAAPGEWRDGRWRGYDLGPVCALAGLLLAGATDVVHINAQTAAMWLALASLCPVMRVRRPVGSGSGKVAK